MIIDIYEGDAIFDIRGTDNPTIDAPDEVQVLEGTEGTPGRSAYLSAVANGYQGTEAAWVASLKGEPGDSIIEDPGDFTLHLYAAMV